MSTPIAFTLLIFQSHLLCVLVSSPIPPDVKTLKLIGYLSYVIATLSLPLYTHSFPLASGHFVWLWRSSITRWVTVEPLSARIHTHISSCHGLRGSDAAELWRWLSEVTLTLHWADCWVFSGIFLIVEGGAVGEASHTHMCIWDNMIQLWRSTALVVGYEHL